MGTLNEENPLLKTLPPETDYLSYLTILEYNLNKQQLPILHGILQDTTLTANIGWDLVHLLLPLLPESEQCLRDVANLGNPREVILKVTESLEEIARENRNAANNEEQDEESGKEEEGESVDSNALTEATANEVVSTSAPEETHDTVPPSRDTRFSILLSMLSTLHPRIKTKYPSRFLSTSLQSVLSTYTTLSRSDLAIEAVLTFSKHISGTKRPALPPRRSSSSIQVLQAIHDKNPAPDPEASKEEVASGDIELQRRLLQSFLTYLAEVYLSGMQQEEDAPGMSYATRYLEKTIPERNVPGRHTRLEMYEEGAYHARDANMGQILALARDLGLKSSDLITSILQPPDASAEETESELPSNASDVPLSSRGSLHILSAWLASRYLFQSDSSLEIELPEYTALITEMLPSPSSPGFGTDSPAYLDALFFLGSYTLHTNPSISPASDQEFNDALQRLSLLSARLASPSQRYQAHQLASTLLHLHSSNEVKLAYIKDTLEHCPYENLKASAVGWVKDELLSANRSNEEAAGIFASPALFEAIGEWLWGDRVGVPMYSPSQSNEQKMDEFERLQSMLPFYLGVLNLLFLVLSNGALYERLGIAELMGEFKGDFLEQLLDTAVGFEKEFAIDRYEDEDERVISDAKVADMKLVTMNCQQVLDKLAEKEKG